MSAGIILSTKTPNFVKPCLTWPLNILWHCRPPHPFWNTLLFWTLSTKLDSSLEAHFPCLHGYVCYTAIIYWGSSRLRPRTSSALNLYTLLEYFHLHQSGRSYASKFQVYLSICPPDISQDVLKAPQTKPHSSSSLSDNFWGLFFSVNGTHHLCPYPETQESFLLPPLPLSPIVHNYVGFDFLNTSQFSPIPSSSL